MSSYSRPAPNTSTYQQRYTRKRNLLSVLYNAGPHIIALLSFLIALASLFALNAMDVITGQKTAEYMSNTSFGWYTSFGTTGLLIALIGAAMYGVREGWSWKVTIPIFFIGLIPNFIDMYFDALSADIVRYGHFVILSELAKEDQLPQMLFRVLISGLSFVGEPLAAASVIIFPVLRELFSGVIGGES